MKALTLAEARKSGLLEGLCKTVEEMGFSPRSQNALHDAGIYVLAQYVAVRPRQISIRNLGETSKLEVQRALADLKLSQGMKFARDLKAHINALLAEFQVSPNWKGLPPLGTWRYKLHRSSYPIEGLVSVFEPSRREEDASSHLKVSTQLERAKKKILSAMNGFDRKRALFVDLRAAVEAGENVWDKRSISQTIRGFLRLLGRRPTVQDIDQHLEKLDAWLVLAKDVLNEDEETRSDGLLIETPRSEFDRVLAVVLGLETFFGSH